MQAKNIIPSLYGLRAISVLLVIAYHLENSRDELSYPVFLKPLLNGHLGVNIFFVISGFIITTLLKKETDRTGHISLSKFYIRRVLRIFPAYYFLLLVYAVLQIAGLVFLDGKDWFFSLTLLKQFSNPGGITGHLWTISAEEIFYLFFPLLFGWLYLKNKKLLNYLLIFICLAAVPVCRMMISRYFPTYPFNVFMRGDAIAIGCLLALNYNNVQWIGKSYKSIGLMVLLFDLSYLILQPGPESHFMQILIGSTGWSLIDNLAIAILLIISIEYKNSLWYGLLNSKPMVFLGVISYSVYLWQQIFTSRLTLGITNQLPLNLALIFISSILSYSLIEKPFLRLKERFS